MFKRRGWRQMGRTDADRNTGRPIAKIAGGLGFAGCGVALLLLGYPVFSGFVLTGAWMLLMDA